MSLVWIVLVRMCIMLLCIGTVLYGDAPYFMWVMQRFYYSKYLSVQHYLAVSNVSIHTMEHDQSLNGILMH